MSLIENRPTAARAIDAACSSLTRVDGRYNHRNAPDLAWRCDIASKRRVRLLRYAAAQTERRCIGAEHRSTARRIGFLAFVDARRRVVELHSVIFARLR